MKSIGRAWTRSSSNSGRRWIAWVEIVASPARFREFVPLRCRPLIAAIEPAGETACPTLLDQSFGEVGGAGGFACRWKLISIAHPNPEKRLCPGAGRPHVIIKVRTYYEFEIEQNEAE